MIAIIGLGFVGLTAALGFSEKGFKVFGYDEDKEMISKLQNGAIPFFEPDLDNALKSHLGNNFEIADSLEDAVKRSKVIFYCVGTPSKQDGSADLTHIFASIENTLKAINKGDFKVLVIKSTVPTSTTKEKIKLLIEKYNFIVGKDIGLANNPEFLREGAAWEDFTRPDRIVIGVNDTKSAKLLEELYAPFNAPIRKVSLNSGEFMKYLSNTFLATLISYSNEMSMIADSIEDIDIPAIFEILHEDRRWFGNPAKMTSYVYPGCGFGGYCLPKDTEAMYKQAEACGFTSNLLKSVINTNLNIKDHVVKKIIKNVKKEEMIGVLGLSFKPGSDDIRNTPSKDIIESLLAKGFGNIIAYDPMANAAFMKKFNLNIEYAPSVEALVKKADHLILLTAWPEFKEKKQILLTKPLYDFRYYL